MGLHLQQEERDPHQVKIATMLSQILVPAGSGSFHSRRKSAILSQDVKNEDIYLKKKHFKNAFLPTAIQTTNLFCENKINFK